MRGLKSIWISAAEVSADLHGSNLLKNLKLFFPSYFPVGIGGSRMREEGLNCIFPAEEISVMGLVEVISYLPKIVSLYKKIYEFLKKNRPYFVVLIDAPDFHFKIAKMCYSLNIPVFYYISPQVWAWREGRIKFLKKYVKKLFCIFPFEESYFKQHKVDVEYVGHPLLEEIDFDRLSLIQAKKKKIAVLPGSRQKEVKMLLTKFYKASLIIKEKFSDVTFTLIKAPTIPLNTIKKGWGKDIPLEVISDEREKYAKMKECEVAIAASGTVTLECGLLEIPCVVAYKVSFLSYLIAKTMVNTKHISMTNLILNEKVYPELIQKEANAKNIAYFICKWFEKPHLLEDIKSKLRRLKRIIGDKRASFNCAKSIWEIINEKA